MHTYTLQIIDKIVVLCISEVRL